MLLHKSATKFVQFMQTTYSLCSEQQLPAKPPAHRSRPGFRTALWMLPCLREPHRNTPWKITLITPSSMGNTHRYVALLSSDAWFVPQSSGSRDFGRDRLRDPSLSCLLFFSVCSLCVLWLICGLPAPLSSTAQRRRPSSRAPRFPAAEAHPVLH